MELLIGIAFAAALWLLAGARPARKASDPFEEGKARLAKRKQKSEPENEPEPGGIHGPFWTTGAAVAALSVLLSGRRPGE